MPLKQLDTMRVQGLSGDSLLALVSAAEVLKQDTSSSVQLKGEILLMMSAEYLNRACDEGELSHRQESIKETRQILSRHQYLVCNPRPSDWLKLARYICQGRYAYVYSRARFKWYFWVGVVGLVLFLVGTAVLTFWQIQWKYRKLLLWTAYLSIVLMALIFVAFQSTCDANIESTRFYWLEF